MAQDWLKACNSLGVPLDDFKRQFCDRCLQVDCTRSIAGTSKFDQRASQWEEQMFLDVPKMDRDDPRYLPIAAQRFIEAPTGPTPEVGRSAWIDPRELDEAPENAQKGTVEVASPPQPAEPPVEAVEPEPAPSPEPPPEPTPQPQPEPPKPPTLTQPMNTPRQQPQTLAGHKKTQTVSDPWAAPKKGETDNVEVVQPGARIRFGGSGV